MTQINSTGQMVLTDHVLNTLSNSFDDVSVIENLNHNSRGYLAVAGGDDSVTLFEVLVDGRMQHLDTIADAVNTTLVADSALSLSIQGETLHLVVASGNDSLWGNDGYDSLEGVAGDDLLVGNNGADMLHGGGGDDHLIGGLNSDTLWGGGIMTLNAFQPTKNPL